MSGSAADIERIAGVRTVADWNKLRPTLNAGSDPASWEFAFREFFLRRISTRYIKPIEILQKHGASDGEGFSIVTIQCALIEFLASIIKGKNYRYVRNGDPPLDKGKEYSNSGEIFQGFLVAEVPFNALFDAGSAKKFYEDVRCGLLHEARTKGGWKILKSSATGAAVCTKRLIVYRDDLHICLKTFIDSYRERLLVDSALQTAFKGKFDHLCKR